MEAERPVQNVVPYKFVVTFENVVGIGFMKEVKTNILQ